MWKLRSVGFVTDLFLVAFDGVIEDKGRYVVVRTPSNPDFWWGNFLLYPEAPDARAAVRGHESSLTTSSWLPSPARLNGKPPHAR